MSNPLLPLPSNETKASGKTSARHARNEKYWRRTYVDSRKASLNRNGLRKKRGSVTAISDLPEDMQVEHCIKMARAIFDECKEAERPVCSVTVSNHVDLPTDTSGRYENPDFVSELRELITFALSTYAPTRSVRAPAVVNGRLTTVVKEVPAPKPESLEDFIRAFPAMRKAFIRLAKNF